LSAAAARLADLRVAGHARRDRGTAPTNAAASAHAVTSAVVTTVPDSDVRELISWPWRLASADANLQLANMPSIRVRPRAGCHNSEKKNKISTELLF